MQRSSPILVLAALAGFTPGAANAQTRDTPVGPVGGAQTVPTPGGPKLPGPETPNGTTRPGGGVIGPIDGLPDAVTVLDILRRLPHFPSGGGDDSGTSGPPDLGPKPKGTVSSGGSKPPKRIATVVPNAPFAPRPAPRAGGTPPAITGAIVPEVRDREVLVTLSAGSDANTVYEIGQDLGLDGDTLYTSALLGTRVVRFRIADTRSVTDVVQQLSTDVRVQLAEPHYVYAASQGAAKPLPVPQYAPQKLHLSEAHKLASGKRIKIAVIDTAIDTTHPAFGGGITETFDALGESTVVPELHGTAIAGIVGARAELTGVAPGASVLGVRAFSSEAKGPAQSYTLAILKGLDWAVLNGARVVNMSFAGPNDPLLGQAIAAAIKRGVVVVAAAGNGGPDAKPAYPGAFPNVIAVTATDNADATFKSANRGTYIAVAAPGVDIIAAAPKGAYDISSGTSMAAAHVSGIAALMLEKNPKLSPEDVRWALAQSARKVSGSPATDLGAGIVDAAGALGAVK
jgi:subtilisin family serine protease